MEYFVKFAVKNKDGEIKPVTLNLSMMLEAAIQDVPDEELSMVSNHLEVAMKPDPGDHDYSGDSEICAEFYDNGAAFGMNSTMRVPGSKGTRHLTCSNVELPSGKLGYPYATTCLYAGDDETEFDGPVAIMTHPEREFPDISKRLIYIDRNFATACKWPYVDIDKLHGTEDEIVKLFRRK